MSGRSETIEVIEPATGEVMASVSRRGGADVDTAVAKAKAAYPGWRALEPAERAAAMRGLADAVDARARGAGDARGA